MPFQITSGLAYEEVLGKLGARHKLVMTCFSFGEELNNRQISELSGLPINCITPRVKELRESGLIIESKKDYDPYTQRLTIFWKRSPKI